MVALNAVTVVIDTRGAFMNTIHDRTPSQPVSDA